MSLFGAGHRVGSPGRSLRLSSSPTRVHAVAVTCCVLAGLVAAYYVAQLGGSHTPKPFALLIGIAGGVIMLNLGAEQLLVAWLFLAPLFQESAGRTRVGQLLALGVYTAPPLAFGLKTLLSRRRWTSAQWFDALPALFVAYVFLSLVVTDTHALRSGTVGTLRGFYQTVALGVIVYYLIAYWPVRPPSVTRICQALLAASVVQSVIATIEWGTGWNLWHDPTWQHAGDVRSIGTLSNPSVTGAFIGGAIVIALAILSWNGPAQLRRLAVLAVVAGLPGLIATKTRGPILATALVAVLCVVLSSRARLLGIGAVALVALTVLLFWPEIKSSSVYQNRIDQKQNVEIRLVLQTVSIRLAERRPIYGWGYDSFDRVKFKVPVTSTSVPLADALASTSHDTYLTLLVEYGAVGLSLFLIPWAFVLARALRAARAPSPHQWFYVAGISAVLVYGITATTLDYRFFSFLPALPWLFLGLMRRQSEADHL